MSAYTLTYQRETFPQAMREAGALLADHYKEIAWRQDKIPLAPDGSRYLALEKAGVLRVYTAREDGRLVGYSVYMVTTHAHYKETLYANNDVLFIEKQSRGTVGLRLIRFAEAALKAEGVQVVMLHIKSYNDWSAVVVRMGYEQTDRIFQKWIGE